ncbi:hypothetical protein AB0C34_17990 [Nocardia sp. NPDC049220]
MDAGYTEIPAWVYRILDFYLRTDPEPDEAGLGMAESEADQVKPGVN